MFDEIPKSWQTDFLLIDNLPTPKNQWLTANKLIELNKQSKIFLEPNILNLYSILIRKIDFKSGERLLQRLPYVTLPCEISQQIRKQSLALAERCSYYFQDTAIAYSIKKWQQKIIDYTENQQRLPFPLFRLSDFWQEFLTQEYVPFQSARGEHFHMPTRLSKDLAYFLGVVIGDGHLNYHNIELVDFSQDHMLMMQKLANQLFGIQGKISGEKKIWLLHLNNKWIVRLTNFLTDQPITGKKYDSLKEPLIFTSDETLRWEFWSGVLDADGSYIRGISFSSASRQFVQAFGKVLDQYKIKYSIYHHKSIYGESYVLQIMAISKDIIGNYLKSRHITKIEYLLQYLKSRKTKLFERLYVKDINPEALITINDTTFFNFELLPMLLIPDCTNYLRKVRKNNHWTQQDLADFLEIKKGRLAAYEYTGNLPITHLLKLLPLFSNVPHQLMLFLEQNDHYHFRSRKTIARLNLKPNDNLLVLLKSLAYCKDYLIVLNNSKRLYTDLKNRFGIEIVKTNTIQNSVLHQYVKTFFVLCTEKE